MYLLWYLQLNTLSFNVPFLLLVPQTLLLEYPRFSKSELYLFSCKSICGTEATLFWNCHLVYTVPFVNSSNLPFLLRLHSFLQKIITINNLEKFSEKIKQLINNFFMALWDLKWKYVGNNPHHLTYHHKKIFKLLLYCI